MSDCQQDYDDLKEATTRRINALNHRVVELMRELDEERKYSTGVIQGLITLIEPHARTLGLTGTWHVADGVKALIAKLEERNGR
jgi:hypothetical protein